MKLIKVAAAVLNQTPLDWEGNKRNMVNAIEEARRGGVSLLCLPELSITGYGCEDVFHSPGLQRTAQHVLLELLPATRGMIVSAGLPMLHGGGLFSAACLMVDGRIAGFAGKRNLAGEGIHYEPRWFKPWPADTRVTVNVGGRDHPLGDLIFSCGGVAIGFEICEDAWAAERPGSDLARRGVDIILNPSASHFSFGKHAVRERFVLEGSRAFHVSYVYANLLGNEAGRAIYDGDAMIASSGRLLATGPRFSFADFHLTTAVVDVEHTRMERARTGSFQPNIGAADALCARVDFAFPAIAPEPCAVVLADWEKSTYLKEEEFTRCVALGLFDYLRKSGSHGYVVSLSGGADSATVACLAAHAVHLGLAEVGRDRLLAKLAHIPGLVEAPDDRSLVGRLLTCVYQATRNSTRTTRDAARAVAAELGAAFHEFDVDPAVELYTSIVSSAIGRPLTWEHDDLALQNIQARVRSPGVWMLANLKNALLLATSNRSEAAVGYATMDGDTSGGLSPIAGIDKAFVRDWLLWLELHGPAGFRPIAALRAVNQQQPTAELRPHAAAQTDEGDLMPYEVLDRIERAAIRDKLVPVEVHQRLKVTYHDVYSPEQLAQWIDRFFRLWARNQWKRERYAPSFHLDDENLDPKTWCRFPILSGGYERELRELRSEQ
ncbi:MAG: NAD(+) synthase [Planctomycetes bacterium]|nr:NAD(+) synthase [Planctomycetota bacterium]